MLFYLGVAAFTFYSSLAPDIDIGILLCSEDRFRTYKMFSSYGTDTSQWVNRVAFTQMPESFKHLRSPWRVSKNVNKADIINKLLEHSLVVQSSTVAKADRRPREKKKFYHHFSIVKYSYLPKDTFKKYVEMHVTRSKLTLKFPGYCRH